MDSDISQSVRMGVSVVLIKFVCVWKRDRVMKEYLTEKNLHINDIDSSFPVSSRIYLNDNLSPTLAAMKKAAHSAQKLEVIEKYKIKNGKNRKINFFYSKTNTYRGSKDFPQFKLNFPILNYCLFEI